MAGSSSLPVLAGDDLAIEEPVERGLGLETILDVAAVETVCTSFADLYKIGIKIFDANDTKIVDVRVGNADWCGYIFSHSEGKIACSSLVSKIRSHPYDELGVGQWVEQSCFSGLKYLVIPISYGGDLFGRIVYGPYLPESCEGPPDLLKEFGEDFDLATLWSRREPLRVASEDAVLRIAENLRQVIDAIVHTAYRGAMTEHLHLETMAASYDELVQSNEELKASVEKLTEIDRLKANFLAMISHELRTPLTSIIGYSEMLLEGMAGDLVDEQQDFVGTIKERGESLLELIGSILDLSRIESGKLTILVAPVGIPEVLETARATVTVQAERKGVELTVENPENLEEFNADSEKIGQILTNLLANALKFTPEGGKIDVSVRSWSGQRRMTARSDDRFGTPEERFIRFEVLDTGIGIDEAAFGDIWKPFFQVDNTLTREYGGTGLGLAIVRSFVEAHSGEVWVESEEGAGAKFVVLIPADLNESPRQL